jgi:hypothetical protein
MHHRRRNVHSGIATSSRLEEEIAVLERRLAQIGPDGDCAYEKAMIRFFQTQLTMRREQLQASR